MELRRRTARAGAGRPELDADSTEVSAAAASAAAASAAAASAAAAIPDDAPHGPATEREPACDADPWALCTMTLAAAGLRLYNLHEPQTPVYDETHVGRFLGWYHEQAFFFDVHPPLSKLLIFQTASFLGYRGKASCPYESTVPYAAKCDLAPQRLVPALCGAALVPLAMLTCAQMGLRRRAATLAGWLVLVDNLFLSVSRLHLNDMVLLLFIAATHHAALHACHVPPPAEPMPSGRATAARLAATGMLLGCALQCKYANGPRGAAA